MPDIRSSSVDPKIFRVLPYTFDANSVYTIQVTVYLLSDKKLSSKASITVNMGISGILSSIDGGKEWTSSSAAPLALNASNSYDIDYPESGSLLSFNWDCIQFSPSYGSSCPSSAVPLVTGPSLVVPANTLPPKISYQFTVAVKNQYQATSTSSVIISVITGLFPTATIETPLKKFNTKSRVIIDSVVTVPIFQTCNAYWSTIDLSPTALSENCISLLEKSFQQDTINTFQLALKPETLSPGGTFTFKLTVSNSEIETVSSVQIIMNSPPYGGM